MASMDSNENEDLYAAPPGPLSVSGVSSNPSLNIQSRSALHYSVCAFRSVGCKYVCKFDAEMTVHMDAQVAGHLLMVMPLIERMSSQSADLGALEQRVAVVEKSNFDQRNQLIGTDGTVEKIGEVQDMHDVTIHDLGVCTDGLKTRLGGVHNELNIKINNLHCLFDESYKTVNSSINEICTQMGNIETRLNEVNEGSVQTTAMKSIAADAPTEDKTGLKKYMQQITDLQSAYHRHEQAIRNLETGLNVLSEEINKKNAELEDLKSGGKDLLKECKADFKKSMDKITDVEGAYQALEQTVFDLGDQCQQLRIDITSFSHQKAPTAIATVSKTNHEILGATGGSSVELDNLAAVCPLGSVCSSREIGAASQESPLTEPGGAAVKRKYDRDFLVQLQMLPPSLVVPAGLHDALRGAGVGELIPSRGEAKSSSSEKLSPDKTSKPNVRAKHQKPVPTNKPQFPVIHAKSKVKPPATTQRSILEIATGLDFLIVNCNSANDKVINWIEKMVTGNQREDREFIIALMSSVCQNVIQGLNSKSPQLHWGRMMDRCDLLAKYIGNSTRLQLAALEALSTLMEQLKHPSGLLQMFFDILHDLKTISLETFLLWHQDAVGPIKASVQQFFQPFIYDCLILELGLSS